MTRAAILARVSRAEQARADRHSLPIQVELLTEYARGKGFDIVRTFEIPGESAYKFYLSERPQFEAAVKAGIRGEFDALIVFDLSRVARSQVVLHETLRDLRLANVAVWSWTGDYDATKDPMRAGLEGIIAEQHSMMQGAKIRLAWAKRFRDGLHMGPIPLGYRRGAGDMSPLEVVSHEAQAIREVFRMRANGGSFAACADYLGAQGIRPRSRQGYAAFSISSMQSLFENEFYAGWVHHGEERRRGKHEAILTDDEWQSAQARPMRHRNPIHVSDALLVGMATCLGCEGPLWVNRTGKAPHVYSSYREPSHHQFRQCPNARTMWRAKHADDKVAAVIRGIGLDAAWLRDAERMARHSSHRGRNDERRRLQAERQRITVSFNKGWMTEEEAGDAVARIDARLSDAAPEPDAFVVPSRQLRAFAELWDEMEIGERREATRIVFDRVWLDTRGKAVRVEPRAGYARLFEERNAVVGVGIPPPGIWAPSNTYSLPELGVAS